VKYKGYTAQIEVDETSKILFGKVLDIKDVITFKGNTVNELEQEFHNSVDDYLE
jgi:predicted HicB family RNase H-like nuclease